MDVQKLFYIGEIINTNDKRWYSQHNLLSLVKASGSDGDFRKLDKPKVKYKIHFFRILMVVLNAAQIRNRVALAVFLVAAYAIYVDSGEILFKKMNH